MAKTKRLRATLANVGAGNPDAGLVTYWASLADLTSQEEAQTRDPVWMAGYRHGVMDMMRRAAEMPDGLLAKVKREAERLEEAFKTERARVRAIRGAPAETPAQKSARTRREQREQRDAAQALEFAALINSGMSTNSARAKMDNMGDVRARRIRKLAVTMGWLQPHHKPPRVAPK